jgi:ferrous iron transport protein A
MNNISLQTLQPGQYGRVVSITGDGAIKRRIIDMGIVVGCKIKLQKFAPLGDPLEIKVRNFNLSLRKREADLIKIEAL